MRGRTDGRHAFAGARVAAWLIAAACVCLSVWSVVGFFAQMSLAALSDVYGRKFFLVASLVANCASLLVTAVFYNLFGVVAGGLLGSLFDVSDSVTYAVLGDVLRPEELSRVYQFFGAAVCAGVLAGPVLAASLEQVGPARLAYFVSFGLTVCNTAWLVRQLPETLQWKERRQQSYDAMAAEEEPAAADASFSPLHAAQSNHCSPIIVESSEEAPVGAAASAAAAAAATAAFSPLASNHLLVQPAPFACPRPLTLRVVLLAGRIHPFRSLSLLVRTKVLRRLTLALVLHLLARDMSGAVFFLYAKLMWD